MTLRSTLGNWAAWVRDPPPALVFEISEQSVCLARLGTQSRLPEGLWSSPLAEGAVEASPIRENVRNAEELDRALRQVLEQAGPRGAPIRKKEAAVLLPDNCARLTILDFENLPGDAGERLSLIRWRLKKAVPFDVDTASIAYQVQRGAPAARGKQEAGRPGSQISVLVAVSPAEVVGQYEAALGRMGLQPGYVSVSVAAALNLVAEQGITMLAKPAGRTLTLAVIDQGQVRLARSLETGAPDRTLTEDTLREMAADLYPTFVYVADNFGAPVSKLVLAGFGTAFQTAVDVFRRELGCELEALKGPQGIVDAASAGIWGFLCGN